MEITNLLNPLQNKPVTGLDPTAPDLDALRFDPEQEKRKHVAKQFEAVLLHQMMKTMKATIPESGLFDDSTTNQYQDMFWSFLAQDVGEQGGLGLWKQIYNSMPKEIPAGGEDSIDSSA